MAPRIAGEETTLFFSRHVGVAIRDRLTLKGGKEYSEELKGYSTDNLRSSKGSETLKILQAIMSDIFDLESSSIGRMSNELKSEMFRFYGSYRSVKSILQTILVMQNVNS